MIIDDEKDVCIPKDVAERVKFIAENIKNTIQATVQEGYNAAVKALYGYCGEITIQKEKWISDENGKIEYEVLLEDAPENGIIIFSPSTTDDRDQINYAELFVSPNVENSAVTLTCKRTPVKAVTMSYIIMRNGALKTTKKGAI